MQAAGKVSCCGDGMSFLGKSEGERRLAPMLALKRG